MVPQEYSEPCLRLPTTILCIDHLFKATWYEDCRCRGGRDTRYLVSKSTRLVFRGDLMDEEM